jgi:response regulator of citrate/malate metabolism
MSSIDQICDRPTVLVIDDDPSVAVAIKRVLKGIVRLISADNAKTGRDLIVAMPSIDLVILDIYLPGYDAIGLLRDLYKMNLYPRVVIISGWNKSVLDEVDIFAKSMAFPVVGTFEKPVDIHKVLLAAGIHTGAKVSDSK